jgi:hypothetical protein
VQRIPRAEERAIPTAIRKVIVRPKALSLVSRKDVDWASPTVHGCYWEKSLKLRKGVPMQRLRVVVRAILTAVKKVIVRQKALSLVPRKDVPIFDWAYH